MLPYNIQYDFTQFYFPVMKKNWDLIRRQTSLTQSVNNVSSHTSLYLLQVKNYELNLGKQRTSRKGTSQIVSYRIAFGE